MRIADDGACAKPIRWVCWRPAVPVSQFVEAIWEMEGHWGGVRYIIPKPVVDVVFSLRHESDRAVTENGAETEPGAAWVAGVHQAVRSEMSAAVHRVGVRFRPGMARAFLGGLAVDELIDRRCSRRAQVSESQFSGSREDDIAIATEKRDLSFG
jgi:hypothetical protein